MVSGYEKVIPNVKSPDPREAICPSISQWLVDPRLILLCQPPSVRRLSGRNKLIAEKIWNLGTRIKGFKIQAPFPFPAWGLSDVEWPVP